ncbi:MAG: putative toxin-antitoxin system toxin component, PIN family, partial [Betaproteobacteria bacterium]|nr:putative toxin-antitoxin system toxin component, PIN family [Betaproteobacteria bacterium]
MHTPQRLVLDTNVWLDWLVFADTSAAPLAQAVASGRARVFNSAACEAELARVLAYPLGKIKLDANAQAAALAKCRALARIHASAAAANAIPLPPCKDADDQKFLELARDCSADFLITRDHALLALARRARVLTFRIVTPRAF